MRDIFLVLGMCLGLIVIVRIFASSKAGARASANQQHSEELQNFLVGKVDELKALLEQPGLEIDAVKVRAEKILGDMEGRNIDGELDDFIADNRIGIETELRERG